MRSASTVVASSVGAADVRCCPVRLVRINNYPRSSRSFAYFAFSLKGASQVMVPNWRDPNRTAMKQNAKYAKDREEREWDRAVESPRDMAAGHKSSIKVLLTSHLQNSKISQR